MSEPAVDPNVNFNQALIAARERQAQARLEADQERDDTGEPTEQAGTGSRRPLAEQIADEAHETPQPRQPETQQFMSPDDPLARFGASPQTHQLDDPATIEPEPEPEPEPETELPPAAETPQEQAARLLAGRYKTQEELEQGYLELERRQGQSSEEMGTLRQQVSELMARANQPQPVAGPAPQPMTQEQLEAGLSRDGKEFLANLYETDHPSYNDAIDVALAVNPRLALTWTADLAAWEAELRVRGDLEPRVQAVAQPQLVQADREKWNVAWRDLATENPEMNQLSETMLQDLQENQWLAAPVKEGLPDAEKAVIENLLVRARDRNRGRLAEASADVTEQERQEKIAATVASASAGAPAPAAGGDRSVDDEVKRLKSSILGNVQGQNVHEAIHGPQGR